jgi:hypothetical protein
MVATPCATMRGDMARALGAKVAAGSEACGVEARRRCSRS